MPKTAADADAGIIELLLKHQILFFWEI